MIDKRPVMPIPVWGSHDQMFRDRARLWNRGYRGSVVSIWVPVSKLSVPVPVTLRRFYAQVRSQPEYTALMHEAWREKRCAKMVKSDKGTMSQYWSRHDYGRAYYNERITAGQPVYARLRQREAHQSYKRRHADCLTNKPFWIRQGLRRSTRTYIRAGKLFTVPHYTVNRIVCE